VVGTLHTILIKGEVFIYCYTSAETLIDRSTDFEL
jgi:hypothetical protein